MTNKKLLAALLLTLGVSSSAMAYDITVTSSYSFYTPSATYNVSLWGPSPDTGFFTVANTGSSVFTGTVGDLAVAGNGTTTDYSFTSGLLTLNPGESVVFSTSPESSNVGGFNAANVGVEVLIGGNYGGTAVSLSAYDSQFSIPFVNQGGCATGCDYGDTYETSQGNGVYGFNIAVVPEPEQWAMMLLGLSAISLVSSRKKAG